MANPNTSSHRQEISCPDFFLSSHQHKTVLRDINCSYCRRMQRGSLKPCPPSLQVSPLSPARGSVPASRVTVSDPAVGAKASRVTDLAPPAAYSASNLKWLHASPICSPTAVQAQAGPRHLPFPRDRDLTQDNAVSSSTDGHKKTDSVPRGPPPGKINAPCLERLLKSTESIIGRKGTGDMMDSSWS